MLILHIYTRHNNCFSEMILKRGHNMLRKQFGFTTIELQWLEYLWNYENMFKTGVVRANEC